MAGGPSLGPLPEALEQALAGADPAQSLGRVFNGLQASLRRPVEILGLLHLATNQTAGHRHADTERYWTIRPDGTSRGLDVPAPPDATDHLRSRGHGGRADH